MYHERVQLTHKMADGYIIPLGMINLVSVVTESGMVGCGAFDINTLDAYNYPAARAGRPDGGLIATIEDLLTGIIKGMNNAARARGVAIGMSGREALDLM